MTFFRDETKAKREANKRTDKLGRMHYVRKHQNGFAVTDYPEPQVKSVPNKRMKSVVESDDAMLVIGAMAAIGMSHCRI